jgi:transposase InsO family protein
MNKGVCRLWKNYKSFFKSVFFQLQIFQIAILEQIIRIYRHQQRDKKKVLNYLSIYLPVWACKLNYGVCRLWKNYKSFFKSVFFQLQIFQIATLEQIIRIYRHQQRDKKKVHNFLSYIFNVCAIIYKKWKCKL